jgi:FkbM family methyltransferase
MALFLPSLKQNGYLDEIHITICNVGSRKLSDQDDYASGGWSHFIPNLSIYGFDADADACDAANEELKAQSIGWTEKHIPLGISNSIGEETLYVTNHPMCSSLYPPNKKYLERFVGISEPMALDFKIVIETTTLDEACTKEGIQGIDFLQIDVQGADLHVLEGASHLLSKSILALQIEVEFNPLYINQPLFADVDSFLRKEDFTLFDLDLSRFPRASSPVYNPKRPGQLLWGDAFYCRDLIREDLQSPLKNPSQILKLACIADVLELPDYTIELLEYLTLNYGSDPKFNFAKFIIDYLSGVPEVVEEGLSNLKIVSNLSPFL